jgi:predicted cation transporter
MVEMTYLDSLKVTAITLAIIYGGIYAVYKLKEVLDDRKEVNNKYEEEAIEEVTED